MTTKTPITVALEGEDGTTARYRVHVPQERVDDAITSINLTLMDKYKHTTNDATEKPHD